MRRPVAGLEQFTPDPLVSLRRILGGEALDNRGDRGADRRPGRPVRVGPLPGDQAPVPPKDGPGHDQPVHPQPSRQEPDQREEDRGRPSQARPGLGARGRPGRIWYRTSAAPSPRAFSTTPGTVRRCCPALVAASWAAASPAAQPSNSFMHANRRTQPGHASSAGRPATGGAQPADGHHAADDADPAIPRPCGRSGQPLPAGGLDQRILPRRCRRHRASPGRRPAFRLPPRSG
jgi:hypothetical protein